MVTPGYVRVVKGEGMPKSKQPGQKGDLRTVFDVQVCPCLLNPTPYDRGLRETLSMNICTECMGDDIAEADARPSICMCAWLRRKPCTDNSGKTI